MKGLQVKSLFEAKTRVQLFLCISNCTYDQLAEDCDQTQRRPDLYKFCQIGETLKDRIIEETSNCSWS